VVTGLGGAGDAGEFWFHRSAVIALSARCSCTICPAALAEPMVDCGTPTTTPSEVGASTSPNRSPAWRVLLPRLASVTVPCSVALPLLEIEYRYTTPAFAVRRHRCRGVAVRSVGARSSDPQGVVTDRDGGAEFIAGFRGRVQDRGARGQDPFG